MPQPSTHQTKPVRFATVVSPDLHAQFLDVAERAGETGSGLLRRFMVATVERAKRGEPIGLHADPALPRVAAEG